MDFLDVLEHTMERSLHTRAAGPTTQTRDITMQQASGSARTAAVDLTGGGSTAAPFGSTTYMTQADFIRAAIKATGLSDRQFAIQTLGTDERTLRRYLARTPKLRRKAPGPVLALCARLIDPDNPPKAPDVLVRPDEVGLAADILALLPSTVGALATVLDKHETTVRAALRKLEGEGRAVRRMFGKGKNAGAGWEKTPATARE
jgi:hypothetical protein